MIQPSYYQERSTLRKIIYEYNQYEEIDLSQMLDGTQTNILGITTNDSSGTPDSLYTYMYYAVLQKYMFAEIGYDSDELFIQRLKAKWDTYKAPYYNMLTKFFDESFFARTIVRETVLDKKGNNVDTYENSKTGKVNIETNDTDKRDTTNSLNNSVTGSTSGTGKDTEYAVQTKSTEAENNTSSQQTQSETENVDETKTGSSVTDTSNTENSTDTHSIDETHNTNQTVTETDFDPEKFTQYLKVQSILEEFFDKFSCLFMQIFTTM